MSILGDAHDPSGPVYVWLADETAAVLFRTVCPGLKWGDVRAVDAPGFAAARDRTERALCELRDAGLIFVKWDGDGDIEVGLPIDLRPPFAMNRERIEAALNGDPSNGEPWVSSVVRRRYKEASES
jgi:hypothetical protein